MTLQGQDRIPAGYVRRAHGIHGDVVVRGTLQDSGVRFIEGAVLVTNEDAPREFEITGVRGHQGDFIITFNEVSDRNAADALRGIQFTIDRQDRRQLGPREWWPEDLVGCDVITVKGDSIGVVTEVITGYAQDRVVLSTPDGLRGEIPFVDTLVPEVDTVHRRIVVDLPEGLLE